MSMSEAGTSLRQRHDPVELIAGLLVLALLAGLIIAAVIGNGRRSETGYRLSAQFDHVAGLDVGSDVRMAGVNVGQVVAETVDPKTFQAIVSLTVRRDIRLPTDSSVVVTSDSLLGGKYLSLSPGGADSIIPSGGRITQTQGAISLEQLLSKFIFSVTDSVTKKDQPAANPAEANQPATHQPATSQPGGNLNSR